MLSSCGVTIDATAGKVALLDVREPHRCWATESLEAGTPRNQQSSTSAQQRRVELRPMTRPGASHSDATTNNTPRRPKLPSRACRQRACIKTTVTMHEAARQGPKAICYETGHEPGAPPICLQTGMSLQIHFFLLYASAQRSR